MSDLPTNKPTKIIIRPWEDKSWMIIGIDSLTGQEETYAFHMHLDQAEGAALKLADHYGIPWVKEGTLKRKIKVTLPNGQQMFYEVEQGKPNRLHGELGAEWRGQPIPPLKLPNGVEQALLTGDIDKALDLLKHLGYPAQEL